MDQHTWTLLCADEGRNMITEILHRYSIYMDINNFKTINDTYGHSVGDLVIDYFGCVLANTFYEDADEKQEGNDDSVPVSRMNGLAVFRYGGDEFIVLITCTEEKLRALIQRLHENLLKSFRANSSKGPRFEGLSVSAGVVDMESPTWIELDGGTEKKPIGIADSVMYFAKELAKKKFVIKRQEQEQVRSGVIAVRQWDDPNAIAEYTKLRTAPKPRNEKKRIERRISEILEDFYQAHKELFDYQFEDKRNANTIG